MRNFFHTKVAPDYDYEDLNWDYKLLNGEFDGLLIDNILDLGDGFVEIMYCGEIYVLKDTYNNVRARMEGFHVRDN